MKRDEAFRLGKTTYEADKPCKAGHWPSKRYVSTGSCTKCQSMYKKNFTHTMIKVQIPHNLLATVKDTLKALGCIVHGQDAPELPAAPPALVDISQHPQVLLRKQMEARLNAQPMPKQTYMVDGVEFDVPS